MHKLVGKVLRRRVLQRARPCEVRAHKSRRQTFANSGWSGQGGKVRDHFANFLPAAPWQDGRISQHGLCEETQVLNRSGHLQRPSLALPVVFRETERCIEIRSIEQRSI